MFHYNIERTCYLIKPDTKNSVSFFAVAESRRTRREFRRIPIEDLSALLWYTLKTRSTLTLQNGYMWQHRPTPSAGGRHPIDVLIYDHGNNQRTFELYDPIAHSLNLIHFPNPHPAEKLIEKIGNMIELQEATIILFAAQFGKTLTHYKNGESLVWRDSGALLATFGMMAEALSLNCCGIGITGEPYLSGALASGGLVTGVGGCLVGKRT
ncbi:MAG TPA: nitroreductase family protein [Candidatus Acidoferrales bacterium]|nr:nitroreductase family protein [Candidatus Acidoferrales bacterium]